MTVHIVVEEPHIGDSGSKCPKSTVLPEASKRPKMKIRAAKVLKFLMNFLQIKPKKKQRHKSKICIPSHGYDSCGSFDVSQEFYPVINNPMENVSLYNRIDNGLSLSWSYLVHDPFVSNLEESEFAEKEGSEFAEKEESEFVEDTDGSEIFYNESYFEDDYCQDYHGHNIRSPTPFCNESFYRIFEPKRTPCGEFKRNIIPETPRRRHASLPNSVGQIVKKVYIEEECQESDICEASDLLDYNQLVSNYPQLGLNIAFDSLLDETNIYKDNMYSFNPVQSLSPEEITKEQQQECGSKNETTKFKEQEKSDEISQWSSGTPGNFVDDHKELNSSAIPVHQAVDESSTCGINKYSDQLSDPSVHDLALLPSEDSVPVCRPQFGIDNCILETPITTHKINLTLGKPGVSVFSRSTFTKERRSLQNLDPGCCISSDSSQQTANASVFPDLIQGAAFGLGGNKSSSLNMLRLTKSAAIVTEPCSVNSVEGMNIIFSSPFASPDRTSAVSRNIQDMTILSTSSPIHKNMSLRSHKAMASVPDFLSPIRQNFGILEREFGAVNACSNMKQNRRERRRFIGERRALCSRFDIRNCNISQVKGEPSSEDDQLLANAADLIVSRIPFKEQLKPDINILELVEYLNSYYLVELSKLSNKKIQTVADYKRIMKEAVDIFTSDRLTHENCFNEILIAILANRPRIISCCEDFILENFHYFISSKEYLEAAPELIIMLLRSSHYTSPDFSVLPQLESEIRQFTKNYLKAQKLNPGKYLRVKGLFSLAFDQTAAVQLSQSTPGNFSANTVPGTFSIAGQVIERKATTKFTCDGNMNGICTADVSGGVAPSGVKNTSMNTGVASGVKNTSMNTGVDFSPVARHQVPPLGGKVSLSATKIGAALCPVIATMI